MGVKKMQAFVNHIYKNKTTLVPIAIMLLGRILMHTTWPSTFAISSSVYIYLHIPKFTSLLPKFC